MSKFDEKKIKVRIFMLNNKIKKKALFISFMLLGYMSHGQIAKIGVKGGLNYADFQTKKFDTEAITSYHFGPTLNIKLFKGASLQGELLYSSIGAKYKKPINNILKEYNNKLGYLAIPIGLQINLSENIYIETGPQFSFLLSNKDHFNFSDDNSYDLGYFGGVGFKLFKGIHLGARYIVGTKDVYPDFNSKTNVLQAYVEVKVF